MTKESDEERKRLLAGDQRLWGSKGRPTAKLPQRTRIPLSWRSCAKRLNMSAEEYAKRREDGYIWDRYKKVWVLAAETPKKHNGERVLRDCPTVLAGQGDPASWHERQQKRLKRARLLEDLLAPSSGGVAK